MNARSIVNRLLLLLFVGHVNDFSVLLFFLHRFSFFFFSHSSIEFFFSRLYTLSALFKLFCLDLMPPSIEYKNE